MPKTNRTTTVTVDHSTSKAIAEAARMTQLTEAGITRILLELGLRRLMGINSSNRDFSMHPSVHT